MVLKLQGTLYLKNRRDSYFKELKVKLVINILPSQAYLKHNKKISNKIE